MCQPPYQPENGGYICHPSSCGRLTHGTVVEYFCDEGYILKGDYKYLTCQFGEWDSQLKLSCLLEQGGWSLRVWIGLDRSRDSRRPSRLCRQRPSVASRDAGPVVHRGVHSQLGGSHPVPGGSVCASAAQTEVPPSVSLTLECTIVLPLENCVS